MFQSFTWNRAASEAFADRQPAYVVAVETISGAAIIPACYDSNTGELHLIGESLFDYRDVLSSGDSSALDIAWRTLAQLDLPLEITAISNLDHWRGFELVPFSGAPQLLHSLSQDFYHPKLGRMLRRLLREGCEINVSPGSHTELIRHIYGLKALQLNGGIFKDSCRVKMLASVAAADPAKCDIYSLKQGSELVAALVTFRDGRWRRFYTTYFDDRWARFSPGLALLHEVTRRSIAAGLDCDYMTGEQPYKQRLATSSQPLFKVRASVGAMHGLTTRLTA